MADIHQYYAILEVRPDASQQVIRQAYKDLMKVWHPDRFSGDPRLQEKALEKTKLINEAYQKLQSLQEVRPKKPEHVKVWENSAGMEFQFIPPGKFMMGSPEGEGEDDEHPWHRVRITKPFYMGVTPVTQAQWTAVMESNPSHFKGDDLPVECVSWNKVRRFTWKLNKMEGGSYRLPTEAEWEYACRAGSQTRYYFGNDYSELGEFAWFSENSDMRTHPVRRKKPNSFGLYDMHGNVWEWCEDWYGEKYYRKSPVNKPKGPPAGKRRVIRGGSWSLNPSLLRSAYRVGSTPENASRLIGFRCVKEHEAQV